jgi:molybdopterin synthase catalytic subunit
MQAETRIHKKGTFTFKEALESVKHASEFQKAGAIACFIGVVRNQTPTGEKVLGLEIEAYEEKANETLEEICKQLEKSEGIIDVQIHHFTGKFKPGEELVYVLVAGEHRQETFQTLKEAVERYKKEVPIFKKEYIITDKGEKQSYWVSEQDIT